MVPKLWKMQRRRNAVLIDQVLSKVLSKVDGRGEGFVPEVNGSRDGFVVKRVVRVVSFVVVPVTGIWFGFRLG